MSKYTNESITQLKGADRVRLRPAVIFGSDDIEGCQHSFFEILSNSIDEARAGYGNEITVIKHADKSITVKDNGRGIPVDYNTKEKKYNWELLFTELYAGGKYNEDSSNLYKFSLGLNGLGLCATQYASEYMLVEVYRDNHQYLLSFSEGKLIKNGFTKTPMPNTPTGTSIRWRPDLKVFKSNDIPVDYLKEALHRQSVVNPKISFILKDESLDLVFEYRYERGVIDYLEELIDGSSSLSEVNYFVADGRGRDRMDLPEYDVRAEIAYVFSNDLNLIEYYHNSSFLEYGGSPDRAVKAAFLNQLDKLIKDQGKYTKNEKKINFTDIEDSLSIIISSFSTITSYENQTKKAVNNKYLQEFLANELKKKLEVFFIENREQAEKIADQVLINKRSREKAHNTRINLKKSLSQRIDITNRIKKFVDCRTKDPDKKELYILEGDSALGSCKLARDSEFQALMPIRGKILNCLKADYAKIFKSDIIMDLLKVLGAGIEISSKHNKDFETFNLDRLRWNKIIICTDADVDGYQIRGLVLAMLYRLVPTLIQEGFVYIAESPLYEIVENSRSHFAYNEAEKNQIISGIKGKYNIHRSKGLGENDPDMMWQTTMSPESRRLIKIVPTDAYNTHHIFDIMLGDNLEERKKYIQTHGNEYLKLLDIS